MLESKTWLSTHCWQGLQRERERERERERDFVLLLIWSIVQSSAFELHSGKDCSKAMFGAWIAKTKWVDKWWELMKRREIPALDLKTKISPCSWASGFGQ